MPDITPTTRKNLTQPADWWEAFEAAAKARGMSLSAFAGECMRARLPKEVRAKLSERVERGEYARESAE